MFLLWDGLARSDEILEVKRDSLLGIRDAFFNGFALRHAAGKRWHGYRESANVRIRINNDRVCPHAAIITTDREARRE